MKPIRFGIVGTGAIAPFHAKAIQSIEGAQLVGVTSRTRENAQRFAQEHNASFVAENATELAQHPDIDAIAITTPSALHREPALAAIAAGKHLMIEKPIDATVEGTDEILAAAKAKGVLVGSIFQARFGDGNDGADTFGAAFRREEYRLGIWNQVLDLIPLVRSERLLSEHSKST